MKKFEWKPEIKAGAAITIHVRDLEGEPIREEQGTLVSWDMNNVVVEVKGMHRSIELAECADFGVEEDGEVYVAEYSE